jgi:predicted MFS family arabinose efflux permease
MGFPVTEIVTPLAATTTAPLGRGLTLLMAAATGIAVANIYYNQPMLAVIQNEFVGQRAAEYIPTATQLGYAAGLVLVVPLGDLMDRRSLIVAQFLVLAVALALAALAPTAWTMVVASVLVGATATVAQQIIPFAASLASPQKRGQTVGTVMSGLLCGVLLSRTLAGFIASQAGWRTMFWIGLPLALLSALTMAATLPRVHPHTSMRYGAALKSMFVLWGNERALRFATMTQAALFASFSAFWTILALYLQQPKFGLGAEVAGLFGVVGAVGIFVAPVAGKIADKRGPALVVSIGALLTLLSWIMFGLWESLVGLLIGVIILDLGIQAAMVSNQHLIFAINPEARGRLNTIYMTGLFLGGSIGSAGATMAWREGGWTMVSVFGIGLALVAVGLNALAGRR